MGAGPYVENTDVADFVRHHPLMERLIGRLCHVTRPANVSSILRNGRIRADSVYPGIWQRLHDIPPTECMTQGAVSLFDFAASEEDLYRTYERIPGVWYHLLDWWWFLCHQDHLVIILLKEASRRSVVGDVTGVNKFIVDAEVCHVGDVLSEMFGGFILSTGNLSNLDEWRMEDFSTSETNELELAVSSFSG